MDKNNSNDETPPATLPHLSATLHAIDLERALTEEDYATNSEALQACTRAWKNVRGSAS